jgi:2-amino-4-hydroxy-6-hydroxymethyldihydropteridine diphosphokinase
VTRVFLGLGANIGNRDANMRLALRWLTRKCTIVAVSSLYRSEAVVPEGAAAGPDFLNAACEIETELTPHELLRFVKEIEYEIGRRPAERWAPRCIDLDLLLYGDAVVETAELTVPHALLAERNFVLLPVAELAPEAVHPVLGKMIGELAEDMDFAGLEHLAGPEWATGGLATKDAKEHEEVEEDEMDSAEDSEP